MGTEFFNAPDGRRIAYADTGSDGPVLLCLCGLTRSMVDYAELADCLSGRYRVLRTDYRGRGESGWADDPVTEYTPMVEAQDALALLDHLGVHRTAIVGTSRGGIIGMLLAAGYPERIRALVLNDIGPVVERAGLDFIMTYLGRDPGLPDLGAAVAAMQLVYGAAFPNLSPGEWRSWAERSYSVGPGGLGLTYDPALRVATEAALEAAPGDLWDVFDAIAAPVLAIRGENSDLMTSATLTDMAARRPDMSHVTVADRGHVPFLDEPIALTAIETFLEAHLT